MHLLNLAQAATSGDLIQFCTYLANGKNKQNLNALQRSVSGMATRIGVRVPTVDSPVLMCMAVSLNVIFEYKYDLSTVL